MGFDDEIGIHRNTSKRTVKCGVTEVYTHIGGMSQIRQESATATDLGVEGCVGGGGDRGP